MPWGPGEHQLAREQIFGSGIQVAVVLVPEYLDYEEKDWWWNGPGCVSLMGKAF